MTYLGCWWVVVPLYLAVAVVVVVASPEALCNSLLLFSFALYIPF